MRENQIQIKKYRGQNERMNAMMNGETVYIVNGPLGRLPIIADSREEALIKYRAKDDREVRKSA